MVALQIHKLWNEASSVPGPRSQSHRCCADPPLCSLGPTRALSDIQLLADPTVHQISQPGRRSCLPCFVSGYECCSGLPWPLLVDNHMDPVPLQDQGQIHSNKTKGTSKFSHGMGVPLYIMLFNRIQKGGPCLEPGNGDFDWSRISCNKIRPRMGPDSL